ncbi:MAG: hypothetical protein COW12_06355 [Candidatus Omnitrophica bacterium CG12_big_fil_rev_8_21_14_0_65_45_16]|nr:MAG: hypothetical protein COW12_06355 [Candidatus Omnitrophica bacterium CG12_big_fil_rev_8_21_14_0_65_45_16]
MKPSEFLERGILMTGSRRASGLRMRLTVLLGMAVLTLAFAGCAYFNHENTDEDLSSADMASATRIDTKEVNGELTGMQASLQKNALVRSTKF